MERPSGAVAPGAARPEACRATGSSTVVLDDTLAVRSADPVWSAWAGPGRGYLDVLARVLEPADLAVVAAALAGLLAGERTAVVHDHAGVTPAGRGWWRWQASRVGPDLLVVTHTDVTDLVAGSDRAAGTDPLTGLPGRSRLHELVRAAVAAGGRWAVLALDVDALQTVNDSLGQRAGDRLLTQLADRLGRRLRAGDVVGRLGGDEFGVLSRGCGEAAAPAVAGRLRAALAEPFEVDGVLVPLTASIGVATTEVVTGGGDELLSAADVALCAAKTAGPDVVQVFTRGLRDAVQWRLEVTSLLASPATAGQFEVHYQPIVHLPSGRVAGVEALIRWRHPQRGLLLPDVFVPIAEESGAVLPMTRWLLGEVCRQSVAWAAAGTPTAVGVNVSARHAGSGTLVDDVVTALEQSGLPAGQLVLELTETALTSDCATIAEQLRRLDALGVRVAIDDFGTGWSTLARLLALPLHTLKIDRSLLDAAGGTEPEQEQAVMSAIVALADTLGIRALAEGVETPEHLHRVRAAGCTYAQGWLFAHPLPAREMGAWLADDGARLTG